MSDEVKQKFTYNAAVKIARQVIGQLESCCGRIMIAGSVRRLSSYVHDVDLVVWPEPAVAYGTPDLFGLTANEMVPSLLIERLQTLGWYTQPTRSWPRILTLEDAPEFQSIPVELYICEPDGSNFSALLQMRTGDAGFNASLAMRAQKMGMRYHAGYGILRQGVRIDDGTEAGIFRALGVEWIEPEERNGDFRMCKKGVAA